MLIKSTCEIWNDFSRPQYCLEQRTNPGHFWAACEYLVLCYAYGLHRTRSADAEWKPPGQICEEHTQARDLRKFGRVCKPSRWASEMEIQECHIYKKDGGQPLFWMENICHCSNKNDLLGFPRLFKELYKCQTLFSYDRTSMLEYNVHFCKRSPRTFAKDLDERWFLADASITTFLCYTLIAKALAINGDAHISFKHQCQQNAEALSLVSPIWRTLPFFNLSLRTQIAWA